MCGGAAIGVIRNKSELATKLGTTELENGLPGEDGEYNRAFVFFRPRECLQCGSIWLPPLPR